jgi:hypothetical protein
MPGLIMSAGAPNGITLLVSDELFVGAGERVPATEPLEPDTVGDDVGLDVLEIVVVVVTDALNPALPLCAIERLPDCERVVEIVTLPVGEILGVTVGEQLILLLREEVVLAENEGDTLLLLLRDEVALAENEADALLLMLGDVVLESVEETLALLLKESDCVEVRVAEGVELLVSEGVALGLGEEVDASFGHKSVLITL